MDDPRLNNFDVLLVELEFVKLFRTFLTKDKMQKSQMDNTNKKQF